MTKHTAIARKQGFPEVIMPGEFEWKTEWKRIIIIIINFIDNKEKTQTLLKTSYNI